MVIVDDFTWNQLELYCQKMNMLVLQRSIWVKHPLQPLLLWLVSNIQSYKFKKIIVCDE